MGLLLDSYEQKLYFLCVFWCKSTAPNFTIFDGKTGRFSPHTMIFYSADIRTHKIECHKTDLCAIKMKLLFEACLDTTHNEVICDLLHDHAICVQHFRDCICLHKQVLIGQVMWLYIVLITRVLSWSSASFSWC